MFVVKIHSCSIDLLMLRNHCRTPAIWPRPSLALWMPCWMLRKMQESMGRSSTSQWPSPMRFVPFVPRTRAYRLWARCFWLKMPWSIRRSMATALVIISMRHIWGAETSLELLGGCHLGPEKVSEKSKRLKDSTCSSVVLWYPANAVERYSTSQSIFQLLFQPFWVPSSQEMGEQLQHRQSGWRFA